jgi:hypothetical protein
MHLGPHPKADTRDEWQIKFVTPAQASSRPPPAVDVLHLVHVKRGLCNGNTSIVNPVYWDAAVKVITGSYDYFIGVGHVGDAPTLLILRLCGQTPKQSFDIVLVKLQEIAVFHVEQGGVIHGHENVAQQVLLHSDTGVEPPPH